MINQDFAQRLSQRMVALNLRQAELAERAGLTRNAISRYVRGMAYPSQASLLELAKALECEPTDLLAESAVLDAEANRLAQELDLLRVRNRILEKKLAECSVGSLELAEKLSRLRTENKRMQDMLKERGVEPPNAEDDND